MDIPASRAIASAVASAYPVRANTAAAASLEALELAVLPDLEGRRVAPTGNGVAVVHLRRRNLARIDSIGMRTTLPVLLGAAALLAGCTQPQSSSTGDFQGDEKDVAQVVADLADDAARNKQAHVCGEILSERLQKAVAGDSSCPNEVKKAFEDADANTLDVDDVTISGSTRHGRGQHGGRRRGPPSAPSSSSRPTAAWRIDSFG